LDANGFSAGAKSRRYADRESPAVDRRCPMTLATLLEQYVSLGIFVVAAGLSALSYLAWRRERDRRMRVITAGYAMRAVYGLVVFLEYPLLPYLGARTLEHGSALLILGGLLTFFVALTRD
jgi:hypothetical protein